MDQDLLLTLLGFLIVLTPVFLLFTIGPQVTKRRWIFAGTGITIVALIGIILYALSIDTLVGWPNAFTGRLMRDLTAAFTEELIRYPGLLLAQKLALRWVPDGDTETVLQLNPGYIQGEFTTIEDPHGMALFFGTFYGMGETVVFYMVPRVQDYIEGDLLFFWANEVIDWGLRITAVMAHIALTYLAMAITSQRGYWRTTILLHMAANAANRIFTELAANVFSDLVFTMYTRFAIVTVAYFLLRPRIRYMSPAVLVLVLVTLFLLIILIGTFIALLIRFFTAGLLDPIS